MINNIVLEANDKIKISYETLDFDNSKKKENGKRYGIEYDHEDNTEHYKINYEGTRTNTTNIVPKDLEVNKYYIKYQYKLDTNESLALLYATIEDNLMKETNGGNIYGIGYQKLKLGITQYLSDYPNFDVYQTDLKYTLSHNGIKLTTISKYIYLKDKNSNNFSKNAKKEYFTVGLKVHTHIDGYHLGAGVFIGKRVFAIMKDGLKVQHHAMEFKESYMCGIGHSISKDMVAHLRYSYSKANEIPINNDNVTVQNLAFDVVYKF
jgi:hypothetical protein